nr:maternal effect embryo arrest 18-3 protein [Dimocarpus longan]
MGSLFTSICPSLVLRGIGEIISSRSCPKVLLLNGSLDRETSGFSASSFVTAITDALNRTYGDPQNSLKNSPSQYINTLLVPKEGAIPLDLQCLASQGIFDLVCRLTVVDLIDIWDKNFSFPSFDKNKLLHSVKESEREE